MEIVIQLMIIGITAVLCIISRDPKVMCIILAVGMISELVANILLTNRKNKKIEQLTLYLMRVQDDLELPAISSMEEGALGILHNEIYKLIMQLKESYAKESKQKMYMVDMLSDISHQLKTPMTAISLMTELLETPGLPEEKRLDYVSKINQQIKRMTWLVRNLLTLSQLEANMLELKKEENNLQEMLGGIAETFELLAEIKDITLSVKVPQKIKINCDKQWTTEAISNIVKNCIEHTPQGGKVDIFATQSNISTEIVIKDTGEGIKKEDLPYIFERFYKTANASTDSVGIGLSMSKQIIMRQNGNITVESRLGKGSTFHIIIYRG